MFVRAIRDFDIWVYNVRAGQLVDLPDEVAQEAIANGHAAAVSTANAIQELHGEPAVEQATADPKREQAVAPPMKRGAGKQHARSTDDKSSSADIFE